VYDGRQVGVHTPAGGGSGKRRGSEMRQAERRRRCEEGVGGREACVVGGRAGYEGYQRSAVPPVDGRGAEGVGKGV
jgi:hypothetical protein